jgi:hypothetical protein
MPDDQFDPKITGACMVAAFIIASVATILIYMPY